MIKFLSDKLKLCNEISYQFLLYHIFYNFMELKPYSNFIFSIIVMFIILF